MLESCGCTVVVALFALMCDRSYLGKIWTDTLVHDQHALKLLVDVMGEVWYTQCRPFAQPGPQDRVMLGTDYPFPLGELQPGTLIGSSSFSDAQKVSHGVCQSVLL